MVITFVLIGLLLIVGIFIIGIYNKLVTYAYRVDETYANIDVILKQRYDSLGNLIQTVKGYMAHEKDMLMNLTKLRASLENPNVSEEEYFDLQNKVSRELPKVMAVAENYPELKSNENFLHLQQTIIYLEENLSAARRTYNAMANDYNTYIKTFPAVLFAGAMGHQEKRLFKAIKEEKEHITVSF